MELIRLENVARINDTSKRILNNISFSVFEGEWVGITGPAGSGKKTLAHVIAGLTEVSAGKVFWRGEEIAKRTENASFCKEQLIILAEGISFIEELTLYQNLTFFFDGLPRKTQRDKIEEIAEKYAFSSFLYAYPKMLSEKQKSLSRLSIGIEKEASIFLLQGILARLLKEEWESLIYFLQENKPKKSAVLLLEDDIFINKYAQHIYHLNKGVLEEYVI